MSLDKARRLGPVTSHTEGDQRWFTVHDQDGDPALLVIATRNVGVRLGPSCTAGPLPAVVAIGLADAISLAVAWVGHGEEGEEKLRAELHR